MKPETTFNHEVAKRVRQAREDVGLSQKELGAKLGLSDVGYGHYERGTHMFDIWQIIQLSRLLGRSVEYLLGLEAKLEPGDEQILAAFRALETDQQRQLALDMVRLLRRRLGSAPRDEAPESDG